MLDSGETNRYLDDLLSGKLEPTNEPYAVAKIAGIKMCQSYNRQFGTNFICAMPTNLYGPGDNFDLETSHVLPGFIRKFHEAKQKKGLQGDQKGLVTLWGTGSPKREFLHVDDLADAALFLMNNYDENEIINVGVGKEISIKELADMIADIVGFRGKICYDSSKPDGMKLKRLDTTRLSSLGWKYRIPLRKGVEDVYNWYTSSLAK